VNHRGIEDVSVAALGIGDWKYYIVGARLDQGVKMLDGLFLLLALSVVMALAWVISESSGEFTNYR
jgi:hypothetical protein